MSEVVGLKRQAPISSLWYMAGMALFGTLSIIASMESVCMFKAFDVYEVQIPVPRIKEKERELPASNRLAYDQSLGFFDDISDEDWVNYYQHRARTAQHYVDRNDPNKDSERSKDWVFLNWDPYFTCPHLRSIGGLGDGHKWTCDIERLHKRDDCLIYSVGSRGEFAFENGIYQALGPHCEIHIFDMDSYGEDQTDLQQKNMHYHQWGLKSSYSESYRIPGSSGENAFSFQEIQQRLNHTDRTVDIFKIDCEGCEWHTYKDWVSGDIRQILIETHQLPVAAWEMWAYDINFPAMNASDFFDAFKENGFVVFNKEVNSLWTDGSAVEWSFLKLRKDFFG